MLLVNFRSSRLEVFCKTGVLRSFPKFTGKHLCQSLFFNKVAGLRPATLLKKRLWHKCFHVNFAKFLRTLFLTEHLWWLLLKRIAYIKKCVFLRVILWNVCDQLFSHLWFPQKTLQTHYCIYKKKLLFADVVTKTRNQK